MCVTAKTLTQTFKPIKDGINIPGVCVYIISCTYLNRHLVDSGAHTALQHHLQHLGVCRVLVCGKGEFLSLLLHVLNGHFHGDKNDLEKRRQQ